MLRRVQQLYRRYSARHQALAVPAFALHNGAGTLCGYVEEAVHAHGRLRVRGWVLADRVGLASGTVRTDAEPAILRPDVAQAYGEDRAGFALQIVCAPDEPITLWWADADGRHQTILAMGKPGPRARLLLMARFARAMLRSVPAMWRWLRFRDPAARTEMRAHLELVAAENAPELSEPIFTAPAGPDSGATLRGADGITIVLPVYNAFDLLTEALARIERHTDLPWHLVVIEDASSDARVRPFLQSWAAARAARVTLIVNERNLGFLHSVNRGFQVALARGRDVVLLNSDALVPAGWATRLLEPLAEPAVASVTPFSNDAEILTVPRVGARTDLAAGEAERIDAVARRFDRRRCIADIPTGIGFCMAIGIDALRAEPAFDPAFGRGYGEEVDWCQRLRGKGWRHLTTAGLFVEHRGGASFGADKAALIAAHSVLITRRYPAYDAEVQAFVRDDPLAGQRLAMAIALAAARQTGAMPLYLGHSLGGGAETDLRRRLAAATAAGGAAVVLRVGGPRRWRLELHWDGTESAALTDRFDIVQSLLEPIERRRIVYSCGVGDRDPVTLPSHLLALRRGPEDTVEMLFHDFFALSPSYTLLPAAGVFRAVPGPDDPDPAHRLRRRGQDRPVTLTEWRAAWGELIAAARALIVFSRDSAAHVRAAYPEAADRLTVQPHRLPYRVPRLTRPQAGRRTIGILGGINRQKGAELIPDLARGLARHGARLVVIGNVDPAYRIPRTVPVHGSYDIADLEQIVARYQITDWLIPSISPETFSFTTHEALATGLPVWCFDLGAQAEAVRAAPNGHVVGPPGTNPVRVLLTALTGPGAA